MLQSCNMCFLKYTYKTATWIDDSAVDRRSACKAGVWFNRYGGVKNHLKHGRHQGTATVSKSSHTLSAPLLNG